MLFWPNLTFDLKFIPHLSRYQNDVFASKTLSHQGQPVWQSFLNMTTHYLLRVQTTILTNSTSDLKDRKYHIDYKNVSCAWNSVSSRLTFVPSNISICHFGTGQAESWTTDARMDGPIHGYVDTITRSPKVTLIIKMTVYQHIGFELHLISCEVASLGIMSSVLSCAPWFNWK